MNWKKLFGLEEEPSSQKEEKPNLNPLYEHEQLLINKIIELLKSKPEDFSARWLSGESLKKSVRNPNGKILIMIETGEIISPTEPDMTKEQKEQIKKLIQPIVERDSKYLIEKLCGKPK